MSEGVDLLGLKKRVALFTCQCYLADEEVQVTMMQEW